jgi:tetratricopeptide (TPR) repeat protein
MRIVSVVSSTPLLLIGLLSLSPVAAHADETSAAAAASPSAVDPSLQEAKFAFEEAQVLYTTDQFEAAAAKFMVAFDKKPFSSFLFNAAVAYEKAKLYDKAIAAFQKYIEVDPQARDAVEVKGRIESLKTVAAPPPEGQPAEKPPQVLPAIATKGLVIIDSKPSGASIYLDDKAKGLFAKTPWQGSLDPRPVKLLFEAKGFKPEEREIFPRTDRVLEVYIALSEQHFLGWIEVVSNVPGADVFIDRLEIGAIGKTPYTGHLKPGKHTLWVQKAGYEPARKEIEVEPGTANTHSMTMEVVGYGTLKAAGKAGEGGQLFVDAAPTCTLPCEKQLKPGDHALAVRKEGMEDYEGKLTVKRADLTVMDVNYSAKPSRGKAWTEAVFSAAFFAGGIYLGVRGNALKDEINNDIKDPAKMIRSDDSRKTTGKIYYIGADVCFGAGLIAAGLSLWNFLEKGPPSTATLKTTNVANPSGNTLSFVPMEVPSGAGMAAAGRF